MTYATLESDYDVLADAGMTGAEIAADWIEASRRAAEAASPEILTVSYGESGDLAYDVFRPTGKPRGAVIFLHGGFWVQGSKEAVLFPQRNFTRAGLCYVAPTYGLAPRYTLDQLVANVELAARSFAELAPTIGVDIDRIALIGHSAGGYLAAALVKSDQRAFTPLGSLLISGLFDLRALRELARIKSVGLTAGDADLLSINGRDLAGKGQIILAVGSREPAGFQRQTADLTHELSQLGERPRSVVMPGCDHFSVARGMGDGDSQLAAEVIRLFE